MVSLKDCKPLTSWEDVIIAIDAYIGMLNTLLVEDPSNSSFYQDKKSNMLWYRQEATVQLEKDKVHALV